MRSIPKTRNRCYRDSTACRLSLDHNREEHNTMRGKQRIIYGVLAAAIMGGAGAGAVAKADDDHGPPTQDQITFAQQTSDLMTSTLFAALVQEITETTAANVPQGSLSISLIFDDRNPSMRLVGELDPLHENDVPQDSFERTALAQALTGQTYTAVEKVDGRWYYRRSNPLSTFVTQCSLCHANFAALPPSTWVGALMERIPIQN
jgi:hypothetical protein